MGWQANGHLVVSNARVRAALWRAEAGQIGRVYYNNPEQRSLVAVLPLLLLALGGHAFVLTVPLEEDVTDAEVTLLAILVTLTPGTLTLDVIGNNEAMLIHFMHVEDPEESIKEIKEGFERRILEVTR